MSRSFFTQTLTVLLALAALAPAFFGQSADQNQNTPPNVLAEDERLPFMQSEEDPAPQEPSSSALIVKSIGALVLVIGLLFFGTWTLKKLGFGNKARKGTAEEVSLSVLSTLAMGNGRSISSIRFGERVLLVGATPQSFTLLAEETPTGENYQGNPRSVAEMLADEGRSFDDEFEMAQGKLGMWESRGGAA